MLFKGEKGGARVVKLEVLKDLDKLAARSGGARVLALRKARGDRKERGLGTRRVRLVRGEGRGVST